MASSLDTKALMKAAGIGAGVGALMGLGSFVPCLGVVCCGVMLLVGAAAGAGYGYFTKQNNMSLTTGMGALGGGIAGLATGLGYSIVNGIVAALVSMLGIGMAASSAMYEEYGLPPEMASQLATNAGFSIGSILLGACVILIIAGVLGVVGGLVYSLATANQPASSPPPAPAV